MATTSPRDNNSWIERQNGHAGTPSPHRPLLFGTTLCLTNFAEVDTRSSQIRQWDFASDTRAAFLVCFYVVDIRDRRLRCSQLFHSNWFI
jgi:hypothetical protein